MCVFVNYSSGIKHDLRYCKSLVTAIDKKNGQKTKMDKKWTKMTKYLTIFVRAAFS